MNSTTAEIQNINRHFELEFNSVFVIQSLPDDDKQTGEELYIDIVRRYCDYKNLYSCFFNVTDTRDFKVRLITILELCKSEKLFPIIHFEIHGSKDGFELFDGSLISWSIVCDLCREINIVTQNQLIVSLATCSGAYISTAIDITRESPFWGFIGPENKISSGELIEGFTDFFQELLQSFNINNALVSLRPNHLQSNYVYYPAQIIFEQFIEKRISKLNKSTKLRELMSKSKNHLPYKNRSERRKMIRKNLKDFDRMKFIKEMKTKFLMGRVL